MAADIVFPEKMEQLDGKSAEEKIKILEDYIRYMTERVDFAFSGYTTKANFKNSVASSIDDVVDEKGFITAPIATQITKDTINVTYLNAMKIKAGSVDAENITGTVIDGKTVKSGDKNSLYTEMSGGYIQQVVKSDNNVGLLVKGAEDLKGHSGLSLTPTSATSVYNSTRSDFPFGGVYWELGFVNAEPFLWIIGSTKNTEINPGSIMVVHNGNGVVWSAERGLDVRSQTATGRLTSVNGSWVDGASVTTLFAGHYIVIARFRSAGAYSVSDISGRIMYESSSGSFTEGDRFELSSNGNSIWYVDSTSQAIAVVNVESGRRIKAQLWANANGAVVDTQIKIYRIG